MAEEKVFMEKSPPPTETEVAEALGSTYAHLKSIREYILESIGETFEEWKYYGGKNGWALKNFHKKRNLYFIGIYPGYFRITFVFGDKAAEKVAASDISPGMSCLRLENTEVVCRAIPKKDCRALRYRVVR